MTDTTQPIAQLRHLHKYMVNGGVRNADSAKRIAGEILGPAIAALEAQAPAVPTYPPLPEADKVMTPSHSEPYALWGLKKLMDYAKAYHAAQAPAVPAREPVATLWQQGETGRTRVVMPDMIVDADARWQVVGPLYLGAAPQPEAAVMTREQAHALRQGHEIAASDGYFEARPQIDSNDRRKVFEAGFQRGWDAALATKGGV